MNTPQMNQSIIQNTCASVRGPRGEHLHGEQHQKSDGGGGERPLGISLEPLQVSFATHPASLVVALGFCRENQKFSG